MRCIFAALTKNDSEMNNKESELRKIVDIVVECCATDLGDGTMSVCKEEVLGKSRKENVVMTRCILVMMIVGAGYSTTTAAQLLKRTTHAVRHLLEVGHQYHLTSRAFRIASAEATLKCRDIEANGL